MIGSYLNYVRKFKAEKKDNQKALMNSMQLCNQNGMLSLDLWILLDKGKI